MRSAWGRWWAVAPLAAAVVPPVLVARAVARFGVNVPFWDEWDFTPLVVAGVRGEVPAALIWAQHNEHRPVVPSVLWLILGVVTRGNVRAVLAANVVIASLTLVVLVLLTVRTVRPLAPGLVPWLVLVSSLVTFSLAQWENWTWGSQLQIFLCVLGTTAAAWLVARWDGRAAGLAAILAAGLVAAFSFASGVLLLALLPVALLLGGPSGSARLRPALVGAAVSAAGVALYLVGWRQPSGNHSIATLLDHPGSYVLYVLAYLGAGLSPGHVDVAARWGAAGLAVFLACIVHLCRHARVPRQTLVPWTLLGVYAVATGCVTGVGRVGLGVEQALAPRYVTIAASFWIALATLLGIVVVKLHADRTPAFARVAVTALVLAGFVLAGRGYTRAWAGGWRQASMRHEELALDAECVVHLDRAPDECLARLYPDPASIRRRASELRELGIGPFAAAPEPSLASYALVERPAGAVEDVRLLRNRPFDEVAVAGWAIDPITGRVASEVLVVVDGDVVGRAVPSVRRRDVARVHGWRARHSGWNLRFAGFWLPAGTHRVEAYAVLGDRRIAPLGGARTFTTPADGAGERTAP